MRTKVTFIIVGADGRTNTDQFYTSIPLDMDSPPYEYLILPMTRHNARLAADLFREHSEPSARETRVMTVCPSEPCSAVDFPKAVDTIRRMVFENPSPAVGGIRPMREADYINARVVSIYTEARDSAIKELDKKHPDGRLKTSSVRQAVLRAVHHSFSETSIATMAAHPLWKRVAWIENFRPPLLLNFVGEVVDPTWWVDHDDPCLTRAFKRRCGVYTPRDSCIPMHPHNVSWSCLMTPFITFLNQGKMQLDDVCAPSHFFVRYALRWMQKYLDEGMGSPEALFHAVWWHNVKMANFLVLNWMEVLHNPSAQPFDSYRFFGDQEVADTFYKSAVS